MKLDHDLIREILLAIEANEDSPLGWITLEIPEHSKRELSYHVELMAEAGLIEAQDLCAMGDDGYDWRPKRLTFRGHEFLDSIREKEIWRQTKAAAKEGGIKTLEMIWEIAKALGKTEFKKRTGIEL